MSFRFHPEAEAEFLATVDWYENDPLAWAETSPQKFMPRSGAPSSCRSHGHPSMARLGWCWQTGFPTVLFVARGLSIHILAVMHLWRHPDYWRDRS